MTKPASPPQKYPSPVRPAGGKTPPAAPLRKALPTKKGK